MNKTIFARMALIDSHSHIYLEQFDEDLEDMLKRSKAAEVNQICMPNIDMDSMKAVDDLAKRFPDICLPMMGLHPCYVKDDYDNQLSVIKDRLYNGKYIAVGECGLDYHWSLDHVEQQKSALKEQVHWANDLELPIVLHTRKAFRDTYDIIKAEKSDSLKGVFHCWADSVEDAMAIFEMGFYIGIGGVLTFKNSGLDKVLERLPLDRVILETDAPYLSPTPHRGKRNEPAYLKLVAERLAEIKGISLKEVSRITSENTQELYSL